MEFIYRTMIEEHGLPKLGASASTLGVRKGKDIATDENGLVHCPDFQVGHKNGMSCAPLIADLPEFAIPVEWGGNNTRVKLWRIRVADLGPELTAEQDAPTHVSIGPSTTRTFVDFVQAIQSTAPLWELMTVTKSLSHASED
ncbi:MAG: hypothetical protein AB7U20_23355 [Planctomycetaceae bacterium]